MSIDTLDMLLVKWSDYYNPADFVIFLKNEIQWSTDLVDTDLVETPI